MSSPALYEYVITCLTLLASLVTCQELNCSLDSPELWLRDVAGELHTFRENITELARFRLQKGAAVSTRAGGGECCFSLFSEADGGGYEQLLEYDTEAILDIEDVKSVFIVECYKPPIHPALKFVLMSLLIIAILYCGYSKGKELIFRRRV